MPAVGVFQRRLVAVVAAVAYVAVFFAFVLVEQPGLGVAHFFYLPICIVALTTDAFWGAAAGVVATALYALAFVVTPHLESTQVVTTSVAIRLMTYACIGALVGWYASRNRTLVGELRQHALQDFLTGVGNARLFDEELARRCALGRPFTLVVADLTDLGRINETHGHEAGNAALRRVADAVSEAAQRSDAVARIGGDEFAILTHQTAEEMTLVSARISRIVAAADLDLSFGTTSYPEDGTTAVELSRKADDRLFAAKLVSRNRRTVVALNRP
jgi:diguanylate cyclase (GGDEF)-like protein